MPYKDPQKRKQWYQENKERIKEHKKQYHQENKERINERSKQYRQENKERIREYKKQYYQKNKESLKEHKKQYRQENKERIKEYNKQYRQDGIACVYTILNKETGRKYVGQTTFFYGRVRTHKSRLKSAQHANALLQEDWNKYGADAFEFAVVKEINKEDFQSRDDLIEHLIAEEEKVILGEVKEGRVPYNAWRKLPSDIKERLEKNGGKH